MGMGSSALRPTVLTPEDPAFPSVLQPFFVESRRGGLTIIGETSLISEPSLGLICSVRCPGSIVLQTYEFFQCLKLNRRMVIGGFHSPMERECLRIILSGRSPVIIFPARSIDRMRIRSEWRAFVAAGRLAIASAFQGKGRRSTVHLAEERNRIVAFLADEVIIPYGAPGSKTERLAREMLEMKKSVRTFPGPDNASLIRLGAIPLTVPVAAKGLCTEESQFTFRGKPDPSTPPHTE